MSEKQAAACGSLAVMLPPRVHQLGCLLKGGTLRKRSALIDCRVSAVLRLPHRLWHATNSLTASWQDETSPGYTDATYK